MHTDPWLAAVLATIDSHRRLADGAISQLTDEELTRRPAEGVNSVAVIMRHLAGNLISRWTDFLTSDGEKPTRRRDAEFEDWPGSRAALERNLYVGWQIWRTAIESLSDEDLTKTVTIRGEPHSVPLAIERSLTHTAYHVGQIMLIARLVHAGDWQWLTIRPGGSQQHDEQTWASPPAEVPGASNKPERYQDVKLAYRIEYSSETVDHLQALTARQRSLVFDAVDEQLSHEPSVETRNRKPMRPNPIAPCELRVRELRGYYDIAEQPKPVVTIRRRRQKTRSGDHWRQGV